MNRVLYILRSTFAVCVTVVLAGGLLSCDSGGSSGEEAPTAQVRFLHASPDAGPVAVTADGSELASNLTFSQDLTDPTITDYNEIPVSSTIEVQNEGGDALTTVDASTLDSERQYTVVVAGGVSAGNEEGRDTPRAIVLLDDLPSLDAGDVGLRVVHGSAALPAVDVFLIPPSGEPGSDNRRASSVSFSETWPSAPSGEFQVESIPDEGRVVRMPTSEGPLDIPIDTQSGPSVPTGRHATIILFDRSPGAEFPWAATLQVD